MVTTAKPKPPKITGDRIADQIYLKQGGRGRQLKYPWLTMKVGDEFLLPRRNKQTAVSMVHSANRRYAQFGRKFAVGGHKDPVPRGMWCPKIVRVE